MLCHRMKGSLGRLIAASALLGLVLLTGVSLDAGDAKGKKKEEPVPILKKADELKASDEKDTKLTKSPRKTYAVKLGEFNLTVTEADKKALVRTGSRFLGKPMAVEPKTTHRGELDEKDPTALQRYYKLFSVQLEKDKTYRFECRPADPKSLAVNLF